MAPENESQGLKRNKINRLSDAHLILIGDIVTEWAYLETAIEVAIWTLSKVPRDDVGACITTHMSINAKIQALESLIREYQRRKMYLDHCEHLLVITKDANKNLCPKRNKLIHNFWKAEEGTNAIAANIVKARGTLEYDKHTFDLEEMEAFRTQISNAAYHMFMTQEHFIEPL